MTILTANETKARVYDFVRSVMRPPLFPPADPASVVAGGANVDIDALIAAAERALLAAVTEKFEALRAAARATNLIEPSDGDISDLVTPGRAVHLTGVTRPTLYRLCVDHQIGMTADGFSLWREDEQRFLISRSRLERFLRNRPLRVRHAETKKPTNETS